MTLFEVATENNEKVFYLLADTEEDNNDHYYDKRVAVMEFLVDKDNIINHGLVEAFNEQPGLECGGIYYYHENYDGFDSAEDCMFNMYGLTMESAHEYTNENPFTLSDGIYYMYDIED